MLKDHAISNGVQNHLNPEQATQDLISDRGKALLQGFLDVTPLIRSIQRSEGNVDCFGKAHGYCDEAHCSWRVYCMGEYLTRTGDRKSVV